MDIVSPDHSFNSTFSTSSILPSQSLISEPPDLSHHLSFVHCNVQSLYPKLDILRAELMEFDIIALTETWLSEQTNSDDLLFQNFKSPERKDRAADRHGGVIVYVRDSLYHKRRRDLEIVNIECIWIEIVSNKKSFLFGVFYRPPSSNAIYNNSIEDSIQLAIDTGLRDVVIVGDFNYNVLNPVTNRKVSSICSQFGLSQCISSSTHFTEYSETIIDLLFVSNKSSVVISGTGDPFLPQETRYHCPIYGLLKFCKPKFKSFQRKIWQYDLGDYDLLRRDTSAFNWSDLQSRNIDEYAYNITSKIIELASSHIPNKDITVRQHEPPWITTYIKGMIRKRKRLYRKAKHTNNITHWASFRTYRNTVISEIRQSKNDYYDGISNKLKSGQYSSKDWWSTLKYFISENENKTIPPLKHDGAIIDDDTEKANILNNFFRDQTLLPDAPVPYPTASPYDINTNLESIIVNETEIQHILSSLPLGKASGPDGINNRILRELNVELSSPLRDLFNQSLDSGHFPDTWKEAHVCPIHKAGDPSLPSNYRPISLLNTLSKVFERFIFKHLYNHFLDNNILTPLQSGFIPCDSTVNQLTLLYDTFCRALDDGKEVRVVFCDISKAFDRVWHTGLLLKLHAAGVTNNVHDWLKSYLSNRKQKVILPGVFSNWNQVTAGVPQGSILGPLLFLLYINDIVTDIHSSIRLFADDTSLYLIVDTPEITSDIINNDLETITNWSKKWLVTFNPNKTETLLISRKRNQLLHPPIVMNNVLVTDVNSHKHLGLYLNKEGTWHQHIDYITGKAWRRINIMRKLKFHLDRKSLEIIYNSFIRPLLEYADTVWDNCTQYEKDDIEKIQTEAARITTGATRLVSIESLYQETCWVTLDSRRKLHKLTLLYKMKEGLSPEYLSNILPPEIDNPRYSLRNADDLQTIRTRTALYYNSFLPSTIREWNSLPVEVRNAPSLNCFKNKVKPTIHQVPTYYYAGPRYLQVIHTRLRMKCSALNFDLFRKNIIESPNCQCGHVEDTSHYFFHCTQYIAHRNQLLDTIRTYCQPTMHTILFGNIQLDEAVNEAIFSSVRLYIQNTGRFTTHL
ncbi:MAG: reverse transcriptase family protein [Sedimenticola sp.]